MEKNLIDSFSGEYAFLSNFFPCSIAFEGIMYPTSEHAFQAAKTFDVGERKNIAHAGNAGAAKKLGRKVKLRKDWNAVRIGIMEEILRTKFKDADLRDRLLATGDAKLVEGNDWNDSFWGVCDGAGKNNLGKLLMKIREEIKNGM